MSITAETANKHANDYAITCCRFEAGTVLEPSNLEDPVIVPDLEESGLLNIPDNCMKIGEVLGAKLVKTLDALTPLTPDLLEGISDKNEKEKGIADEPRMQSIEKNEKQLPQPLINTLNSIKIHIGEGKDISLEIPLIMSESFSKTQKNLEEIELAEIQNELKVEEVQKNKQEEKIVRTLTRKYYKIDDVALGEETKIEGTKLTIRKNVIHEAIESEELVVDVKVEIITADKYGEYSETIMDIQPIATKEEGELGEGITRVLDGVIVMVTGTDENGVQIGEFGSSEGILDRNIMWGRPGCPDKGEIFIKTQVTIKAGTNMERPGPMAAHKATDFVTQEIREALKKADANLAVSTEEFVQKHRLGKKKVVIVKEIMGQGAMHDNFILPVEPCGTLGAKPNVDLGNVPIVTSPLQVLDGCIHAITCIGPASKENTRHYWREPLVIEVMNDDELDLVGIIFVGSPQVNSEKFYVSKILGMTIEAMDLDGAIITTEGFGNNHVDFASHIEQVGMRGISVVGVTYSAVQGQLVVGNKYMDAMIDLNKSSQGIENEILGNNTLTHEDAIRAVVMLKAKMEGEIIKEAERKWNPNVKLNNVELIGKEMGKEIELTENELSLEKSKKRREVYEIEE
ncbi:MAG: D-proline reductase (dithiol) proprotein PrdA [Clostridiales bacterium]|nr:D-proline reductase (dithiol) proprotein PrdA [Clostridiales bacterium]